MQDYHDFLSEVLISETQLAQRVAELGAEISRDYKDGNLLLVCILRGGVMFLTDLMRMIEIPLAVEFMAVSSYGAGKREISRSGAHHFGFEHRHPRPGCAGGGRYH